METFCSDDSSALCSPSILDSCSPHHTGFEVDSSDYIYQLEYEKRRNRDQIIQLQQQLDASERGISEVSQEMNIIRAENIRWVCFYSPIRFQLNKLIYQALLRMLLDAL